MDKQDQNFNNETKRKKKRKITNAIILSIIFLVPIGFGIFSLLPDQPAPTPPPTPVVTYEVKLINNDDNKLTLTNKTAYSNKNFSSDIILNRSIAPGKTMPDSLSASDVLCLDKQIAFTYKVSEDKYSAHIDIPSKGIKGNITINVPLVEPTETFSITLKANGGKFLDGLSEKTFTVAVGQKLKDLSDYRSPTNYREGYHFTHWQNESSGETLDEDDVIPYAPDGATYIANCGLNEFHVSFKGDGGTFNGQSTLDLDYCYDDVINEHDGYVTPEYDGHTFLYYEVTDVGNENQKFYETDRITINKEHEHSFGLRAVYADNIKVTFNVKSGEGKFSDGKLTKTLEVYDGITIKEIEEKYGTGYVTPTPDVDGTSFIYYKNGDEVIYRNTPLHGVSGELTLLASISECQHPEEYVNFAVDDNHVYGICPDCGAAIKLTDDELAIAAEKKAILVPDKNDPTLFKESDQQSVRQLIHDTKAGETLHLYLIGEDFELYGSRDGGIVNVHLHGVLNNENQKISSFRCYGVTKDGWKTYVGYGGMHLITENLIMNGSLECGTFYLGVQSDYLTCIDCDFKGIQSFYAAGGVVCTNCIFDSTMLEKKEEEGEEITKSEYAIYSYASENVEFNQCYFKSRGKALKLYCEGGVKNAVYKLTDCIFEVVKKLEDKAAIQVDSRFVQNYDIYITRCSMVEGKEHTGGLYNDSANPSHTHFIVS